MKVKDLILELRNVDQEAEVFIWDDGTRKPIADWQPVDECGVHFVDLNVNQEA